MNKGKMSEWKKILISFLTALLTVALYLFSPPLGIMLLAFVMYYWIIEFEEGLRE